MAANPRNYRHYLGIVVQQHPSVLAAQNQIESARQDVEGAKWQFMPTPSIGAEKSNKSADGFTDRRTTFARLQQPLWTGGRLTAQLDKAQAQETIASLTLAEQRLTLAQRWLQLWAETQAAELKVQAYADSEEQHRKYVQQVQNRAKEGQAPRSDTQLSLTRLAAVQAELEQANAQKRQAISRLEQMYGGPLPVSAIRWTASLPNQISTNGTLLRPVSDWITQIQDQHPSLQKAAAVTRTVQADVEISKAKTYPELYLRGEILDGDVSKHNRQIYVGMTSSFGAGLSNLSTIAAAQAKLDAQAHETETRRRDIAEQVQADVQSLESQTQRLQYLEQAYASAQEYLQASERQFAAGRKSWQELMNTAREKAQTLAQLADAKSLHWLAQQRLNLLSMGVDTYLNGNANP
ncbi:TolC family protein [Limnohabitans lacus]|nr:TolC family protein [Limnohabitans sp. HM2-2]